MWLLLSYEEDAMLECLAHSLLLFCVNICSQFVVWIVYNIDSQVAVCSIGEIVSESCFLLVLVFNYVRHMFIKVDTIISFCAS